MGKGNPMLMLEANGDPEFDGQYEVELTGVGPHRVALPIRQGSRVKHGQLTRVDVIVIEKTGTNPTAITSTILDKQDVPLSQLADSPHRIFRSTNDPVNGSVVNDQLVGHVPPQPIKFVVNGLPGELELVLAYTGGDGGTVYKYLIQLLGDRLG
jgi:hypothetical protein